MSRCCRKFSVYTIQQSVDSFFNAQAAAAVAATATTTAWNRHLIPLNMSACNWRYCNNNGNKKEWTNSIHKLHFHFIFDGIAQNSMGYLVVLGNFRETYFFSANLSSHTHKIEKYSHLCAAMYTCTLIMVFVNLVWAFKKIIIIGSLVETKIHFVFYANSTIFGTISCQFYCDFISPSEADLKTKKPICSAVTIRNMLPRYCLDHRCAFTSSGWNERFPGDFRTLVTPLFIVFVRHNFAALIKIIYSKWNLLLLLPLFFLLSFFFGWIFAFQIHMKISIKLLMLHLAE